MKRLGAAFAGSVFLFASGAVTGQFHRRIRAETPVIQPPFDRYVLSLSWAPGFCAQPDAAAGNPRECAPGRGIGFVVNGLWPESGEGKIPAPCGPAKRVSKAVVNMLLRYMLAENRIQQEWAAHGVCTGLSPGEYFGHVLEARTLVQIPVEITSLEDTITASPEQIEMQFAGANPAFPKTAFRTFCRYGALEETRICFDRTLKPQSCPASEPECPMPAIVVRPPCRLSVSPCRNSAGWVDPGPGLPPDFARHLDDSLQFGPLLRLTQNIALLGAGEAALGAEA
jgi:ribonuclease T2